MRNVLILAFLVFFIMGCSDGDISNWSEQKCIEAGYKYEKKDELNLRTGKYETRGKCVEK